MSVVSILTERFDVAQWISFLKDRTSNWAKICFHIEAAAGAESKDGITLIVKPLRLTGFEIQILWNWNISIQGTAITQSSTGVDGMAMQLDHIYYNPASFCSVLSAQPWGPHMPSDCAHSPAAILPALSSHFETRAWRLRPSVCFFWGNLMPTGIWTYVIKRTIRVVNLLCLSLVTWGAQQILTPLNKKL